MELVFQPEPISDFDWFLCGRLLVNEWSLGETELANTGE